MTLYRDATPTDRIFVTATWSSSYKNAHAAGMIPSEDYPEVMHRAIGKLLARPGARAIVAYEPPDFLYGFIAGDVSGPTPVVWYVYVKGPYRSEARPGGSRVGPRHARGLFRALGVDPARQFLYACRTSVVSRVTHKIPNAKFVPAAARYTNYLEQEQDA